MRGIPKVSGLKSPQRYYGMGAKTTRSCEKTSEVFENFGSLEESRQGAVQLVPRHPELDSRSPGRCSAAP
ncbi:MAG TPA: hypothetical protein PKW05_13910, partial [Anaerolineae bacterium]|nr:hypothetical protein [Anaerolineae bacterium]